ncbi:MAG TPA: toll/interleukin-1 receptor domain-containing protein [Thermoanaerobaculia bacterium]|nr:toll/interleukin-1 receptor domain-containing protein [Thermoanaerobaculia bacterium]
MPSVFVSYRRSDADAYAEVLFSDFVRRFGDRNVFIDVKGIEPGTRFAPDIRDRLSRSDVVLVLIGPSWLDVKDTSGQRRIDDPDDWVRFEVRTAFELGKRVIPVLVRKGSMPSGEELPADIASLAALQAFTLNDIARDLPALAGKIDGRIPVLELAVTLGLLAAFGGMLKWNLMTSGVSVVPSVGGLPNARALDAYIPRGLYFSIATGIYYGFLVFGALLGVRSRGGWRFEDVLRPAGLAALGAGLSDALAAYFLREFHVGRSDAIYMATQYGFWYLGLGIALAWFYSRTSASGELNTWVITFTIAIAVAAFTGPLLLAFVNHSVNSWLESKFGLVSAFNRSILWLPIVSVAFPLAFGPGSPRSLPLAQTLRLALPVAAACAGVDLLMAVIGLTEGLNQAQIKVPIITALFYATLGWATASSWNKIAKV